MNIPDPSIYFGKTLRVYSLDGTVAEGWFRGYDYDFDDDGKEFLEFDVYTYDGFGYSFTEEEIDHIEVIGDAK